MLLVCASKLAHWCGLPDEVATAVADLAQRLPQVSSLPDLSSIRPLDCQDQGIQLWNNLLMELLFHGAVEG